MSPHERIVRGAQAMARALHAGRGWTPEARLGYESLSAACDELRAEDPGVRRISTGPPQPSEQICPRCHQTPSEAAERLALERAVNYDSPQPREIRQR